MQNGTLNLHSSGVCGVSLPAAIIALGCTCAATRTTFLPGDLGCQLARGLYRRVRCAATRVRLEAVAQNLPARREIERRHFHLAVLNDRVEQPALEFEQLRRRLETARGQLRREYAVHRRLAAVKRLGVRAERADQAARGGGGDAQRVFDLPLRSDASARSLPRRRRCGPVSKSDADRAGAGCAPRPPDRRRPAAPSLRTR